MALTIRQNLLETIHGGRPDRLVKQFEYLGMTFDPVFTHCSGFCDYKTQRKTDWGYWVTWPEGVIGPFPMHDAKHKLLKDVTEWKSVIKAPDPHSYSEEEWELVDDFYKHLDREEYFATAQVVTGVFEKCHYFMGMDDACINMIEEPEAMHELIDYLTDWEIECAKVQIEHFHPDALYHHDDFGSSRSLLISPDLVEEFFVPAYKKIYGYYREHGVELIVHHSDSYAAPLIPLFIEMGVDIWQGALSTNNLPELIRQYGGQISFHGGMDNSIYDVEDWSRKKIRDGLRDLIDATGVNYIIPALTAGGPVSSYDGVYDTLSEEIDALSAELFS